MRLPFCNSFRPIVYQACRNFVCCSLFPWQQSDGHEWMLVDGDTDAVAEPPKGIIDTKQRSRTHREKE